MKLNHQIFDSLAGAKVVLEDHRIDCIVNRAHSTHDCKTPAAFAAEWLSQQGQPPAL